MSSRSESSDLTAWVDAGVFGPAERHGAEVLTRAAPDPLVQLGAAFALWAPLHGHTCVDLTDPRSLVRAAMATTEATAADGDESPLQSLPWPDPGQWAQALRVSPVCRVVGCPDTDPVLDERPLVLCGQRLYTQRQWTDECVVAAALRARAGSSGLSIIVGGPGSGKTYTIAHSLAALMAGPERSSPRVALVAPTGKAASRLREAIAQAAATLPTSMSAVAAQLAELGTSTIHRLLGPRGARTRFQHNASHPLPHDIVIVDEASMIALPLLARLVEALRPDVRLVLVGDPDQLKSIEVGSVLADIVEAANAPGSPLSTSVVRLGRSRRQQADSPIHTLAEAIRDNRANDALHLLRRGFVDPASGQTLLSFVEDHDPLASGAGVRDIVAPAWTAAQRDARAGNAAEALGRFASVRVLCAHRTGRHGVREWNRRIESWLTADSATASSPRFYPGRPLLATRNDLRLGISNGDTGIVVNTAEGMRAAFVAGDRITTFAPAQLDAVETAYAMTIHKSQGSEYGTVVVVLPPASSPLIGRELLYTAVTRTIERLVIVGTADALTAAIHTPARRASGLAEAISQPTVASPEPIKSTKLS